MFVFVTLMLAALTAVGWQIRKIVKNSAAMDSLGLDFDAEAAIAKSSIS